MAASNFKMVIFMAILASMTFYSSLGVVHKVGDDYRGWKVPQDPNFYNNWQSKRTFKVADILYFGFETAFHDVSKVNKEQYDKCQAPDPGNIITQGPALINLTEGGDHYYICSITGHCNGHQKLAIHVS